MSFIVTIRAKQAKPPRYAQSDLERLEGVPLKWAVIERFDATTAKEATEEAFRRLSGNPECSVTIMRRR